MKLFVNDNEYELELVKIFEKNNNSIHHLRVIKPTSDPLQMNLKTYMCTVHYNNNIYDLGEDMEIKRCSSRNVYYVGDSPFSNSTCFKLEKPYLYPLFVNLKLRRRRSK